MRITPRGRLVVGILIVFVAGAVVALAIGLGDDATPTGSATSSGSPTRLKLVIKSSRPLTNPISGESVAAANGHLLVIGGLDSADVSAAGIYTLDPGGGQPRQAGTLAEPLHDAAAATLGDRVLVFGGGSSVSGANVESFARGGSAHTIGQLPAPRSDLAAVTVGGKAYVLGGYDGQAPSPDVLATTDGQRFATVAKLPVPVRYPAAVASGHSIYAFGGETANGQSTDAIQQIDARSGAAHVVGHLPAPNAHASAAVLGGRIYVLGGTVGGSATRDVLRFDPAMSTAKPAGRLPVGVSNSAAATLDGTAYLVGGVGAGGAPMSTVVTLSLKPVPQPSTTSSSTTSTTSTDPPATASTDAPFTGDLLIADRGNNRLLLVDASKRILWRYPGPGRPAPKGGFYFPDDAFFIHGGTGIISNEEDNNTIVQIGYPSGKLDWSYGHPRAPGSTAGYLNQPDDAYLLRDGSVSVADARNCRILFIGPSKRTQGQLGTTGDCSHDPPRTLAYPNGATPLPNGNFLISEVNGSYVDEITRSGRLVWGTQLPIAYPSDPQQLGPNLYLVADYSRPGGIYEFNRAGKILWAYHPSSGDGMLDHPSLAERLPNGLIAVNDDYRHRVAIIDPKTRRIVWQYGHTDHPGTGPDHLKIPDGFDLLQAGGVTPTHPNTG